MKTRYIFLFGAVYGLLMRVIFGLVPFLNNHSSSVAEGPMLTSFVVLVPLVIGIYTAYAARVERPRLVFALFGPWVPTLCFVLGTALTMIEGSICIAMAVPIFCVVASVGGLIGWLIARMEKPGPGTMNALLVLPLVAGYVESNIALPRQIEQSATSVHFAAKPEVIWGLINHVQDIKPEEVQGGLAYMIGVPYPIEGVTKTTKLGLVRASRWGKNVRFDEPVSDWQENRFIKWTYAFNPESFPAGALDDHVMLGGKYFDLIDTSYRLTPEGKGTRVDMVVNYRVSTNFNWYARWCGKILVDDSSATILNLYKRRAES